MDVATSTPPIGEQAVAAPLPLDTRLGSYRLTRVVGQGGFGIVYEAQDLSLQRRVAIKEYMPSQLATRTDGCTVHPISSRSAKTFELGRRSFVAEARLLAQFRHPGLLEVLHFWEENGTAYMAMPFYEGRTLQQVINKQSSLITQEWLLQTVRPLLDALEHMHAADCYHRDVSADNILILNDGRALLLDLGTVRRAVGDSEQALTVMLKPGYAPIEQYLNDPTMRHGPWTDIYALAATLYHAVSGKLPAAAAARMMHDGVPPLSALQPPGYDNAFLDAIDKGLSVRPENRPQSIAEFRELLFKESAVEGDGGRAAAIGRGRGVQGGVRRTVAVSIGALVVAAAAFGWMAAWQGGEASPPESAVDASAVGIGHEQPATAAAAPGPSAPLALSAPPVPLAPSTLSVPPDRSAGAPAKTAPHAEASPATTAAPARPTARATATVLPAQNASKGTLRLAIEPWGEIYVDGVRRGVSPPLKQLSLPAGNHRVEIRNPGAAHVSRNVEVDAGKQVIFTHRFE